MGDAMRPAAPVIQVSAAELEILLAAAAGKGATEALQRLGLHDEAASRDMRELRDLIEAWRSAKRGAFQTIGKLVAVALLGAVAALIGNSALMRKLAE